MDLAVLFCVFLTALPAVVTATTTLVPFYNDSALRCSFSTVATMQLKGLPPKPPHLPRFFTAPWWNSDAELEVLNAVTVPLGAGGKDIIIPP
jgi:hypothetical protein